MPPPTTMVMKMPEAASVYLPRPSTERLKMPPHMMEVHRPQRAMSTLLVGTGCSLMNERVIVLLSGMKMLMMSSRMATADTSDNWVRVDTLPEMKLEQKRPIIIRNQ